MAAPQGRHNPPNTEEVSGLSVSAAASSTLGQFSPEVDEHFYRDLVVSMSNWVQKDAAELLAISPRVMNYKIKTLGIVLPLGRRSSRNTAAVSVPDGRSAWEVG